MFLPANSGALPLTARASLAPLHTARAPPKACPLRPYRVSPRAPPLARAPLLSPLFLLGALRLAPERLVRSPLPELSTLAPPSQAPLKVRTLAPSPPKRSSTLLASVSIRLPSPLIRAAGSGARAPLSPRAPQQPHSCPGVPRVPVPLARAPLRVQNRPPPPAQAGSLSSLRWLAGTRLPWALRAPPSPRAPGGARLRTRV